MSYLKPYEIRTSNTCVSSLLAFNLEAIALIAYSHIGILETGKANLKGIEKFS